MPINADRINKLKKLGLSEHAARAYLALLDLGEGEARDISTLGNVPTSKLYGVLEQLAERGLVIIYPEAPKRYAPVPIEEYLGRLQASYFDAARAIDRERDEIVSLFPILGTREPADRGRFTVIRGRRNVLEKITEMVTTSTKDYFGTTTAGFIKRAPHYLPIFQDVHSRGVTVRFLVPLSAATLEGFAPLTSMAQVRARDNEGYPQSANVTIGIADGARAFLIHFVPDDGNLYSGKDIGIFTDYQPMVSALTAILEPAWARATPYAARREEIAAGGAVAFTRIHPTPPEAHGALLRAIQGGVAAFDAVDTAPATPRQVQGRAEVAAALRLTGARSRVLFHATSEEEARHYEALMADNPRITIRHLPDPTLIRFAALDNREAIYAAHATPAVSGARPPGHLLQSTDRSLVRSLRAQFERLWADAVPLDALAWPASPRLVA